MTRSRVHIRRTGAAAAGLVALFAMTTASASSGAVREVSRGDRLEVRNYSGTVSVIAWERDAVRVTSSLAGEKLLVQQSGRRLIIVPAAWAADAAEFEIRPPDMVRIQHTKRPPSAADIAVWAPAWMPVTIEGPFTDATIEGIQAGVNVMVMGETEIRSVVGPIVVVAMKSPILIEDSTGEMTLGGAGGSITVRRSTGGLRAETTSGDVILEALRTVAAEVATLSGDITVRGALSIDGVFDLSAHGGDITLTLPGTPDAVFSLRSIQGQVLADLARPPEQTGDRLELVSGDGGATVRAVTFSGTIRIEKAP